MEKKINMNIPADKFQFVHEGDRIRDKKFEDKPIGYFKDALIRFRKSKASVVAFFIIVAIILYAFVTPLLYSKYDQSFMVNQYAKKPSRIAWLRDNFGIMDGGVVRTGINEAELIRLTAISVAAASDGDNILTAGEAEQTEHTGLLDISDPSVTLNAKKKEVNQYDVRVDTYLEVGFIYKSIPQSELQNILNFQEETGIQVLFPLVEDNQWNPDASDANNWYKARKVGNPVSVNESGKAVNISYSADMVLEDNYMRDAEGNLVYYQYTGGGSL